MRSEVETAAATCRLSADEAEAEATCPRCGAEMTWTKASWHCLACRYKEGCCG
jgi:Zn finger protein HypA/HybF involved in hydrogenase expression